MRKIKLLIGAALLVMGNLCATHAQAVVKDSVVIAFDATTRMVLYGASRESIEKLSRYDLNRLIRDITAQLDSLAPKGKVQKEWVDGKLYLNEHNRDKEKDGAAGGEKIRMNFGGVRIGKDSAEVYVVRKETKETNKYSGCDTVAIGRTWRVIRRSPRQGIDVKFGLNMYGQNRGAGYAREDYDLRTGGSRFVSVGIVRSIPVIKGRKAGFVVDVGLNASWYNLMFEGNQVIRKETDKVVFPVLADGSREVVMKKSKLVAPYVNLEVMPTIGFAGTVISHLSAGMYGGYRLGGYHRGKTEEGKKEKVKSDYFMEAFRYGVAMELGIRNFPDLFVNYDINGLFEDHRGPQVRMLSFGIRL